MLAIVMFDLPINVWDKNVQSTKVITIRIFDHQKVGHGNELQHHQICRVVGQLFHGLQDGKKCQIYLKLFFYGPPMRRMHTHTHTPTHTPRIATGENTTHSISLKSFNNSIQLAVNKNYEQDLLILRCSKGSTENSIKELVELRIASKVINNHQEITIFNWPINKFATGLKRNFFSFDINLVVSRFSRSMVWCH